MATPNRFFVSDAAPAPETARYAHAVEIGGILYVTGQLPIDPDRHEAPLPASIEAQTELVFVNLRRILHAANYQLENTVFARIYLTDFERDYAGLNRIYHQHFRDEKHLPGRTTVGVATLGRKALVEIDLVVAKGEVPLS